MQPGDLVRVEEGTKGTSVVPGQLRRWIPGKPTGSHSGTFIVICEVCTDLSDPGNNWNQVDILVGDRVLYTSIYDIKTKSELLSESR